jgi:hypothetical protein
MEKNIYWKVWSAESILKLPDCALPRLRERNEWIVDLFDFLNKFPGLGIWDSFWHRQRHAVGLSAKPFSEF